MDPAVFFAKYHLPIPLICIARRVGFCYNMGGERAERQSPLSPKDKTIIQRNKTNLQYEGQRMCYTKRN